MQTSFFEINLRGRAVRVPSVSVDGKPVIALGRWLRIASVYDEEWMEGEAVQDPKSFLAEVRTRGLKADIFTFAQRVPDTKPRHRYPVKWDNAAVIPITTFAEWWEKRLPQVSRKNIRRASKRGVTVRPVKFDDEFVRSIVRLFDQTLVKQGTQFVHHGKNFDTIKKEFSTMLERSEFLAAYGGAELIGFVKLVYMGKIASILHILAADQHYDKRPTNALIAKTVEICEQKKITHLVYGKYTYGNKTNCPLREFKRRNGFEELRFPRYYVPLTVKGSLIVRLKLHLGLVGILPANLLAFLIRARAGFLRVVRLAFPAGRTASGPLEGGDGRRDLEGETA